MSTQPEFLEQRVLDLLSASAQGLGVDALHAALGGTVARRTLQRRLAKAVAQGRIVAEGAARSRRYRSVGAENRATRADGRAGATASNTSEPYPPTSPAGDEIRAHVRRPLAERRPVSYDLRLLEAYEPGRSFYLPAALREQLHALGRSSVAVPKPAGTFARDILGRLLIDLSWASSRLEGNTYTRLDTERLIEFGEAAAGKDAIETQMILNHKAAIEFLVGDRSVAVDTDTALALHALLSDGLLRDPAAGGRVRRRAVEIAGSVYRPLALPQRLEDLLDIVMRMASDIDDALEQAFFLMVHIPYLQPFEDVNKRVSRLVANIPLMRGNLGPLSFIDVPVRAYTDAMLGVYELGRIELLRDVFVWAYERSCQQYVAVQQQLVPPDLFRLRHRAELGAAVKAIVQRGLRLDQASVEQVTPKSLRAGERRRFAELLRSEFASLHEGNAVRFGLRPLELAAWTRRGARLGSR